MLDGFEILNYSCENLATHGKNKHKQLNWIIHDEIYVKKTIKIMQEKQKKTNKELNQFLRKQ